MQSVLSRRQLLKFGINLAAAGTANMIGLGGVARASAETTAPRFGLNYVPRKHWWYEWVDWDSQAISEDLDAIRNLGMDHIRIQCIWPIFQPGINYVDKTAIERLRNLLDLATKVDLDVQVTVLDGWLSGYSFLPPWIAPLSKSDNLFTSAKAIEAEKLLFRSLAEAIGRHDRFLGFDLGNEIDVVAGVQGNAITTSEGDHWATTMLDELARIAPGKFHVNGVDHVPWFQDSGFSRTNLATAGAATVVHCYAYWSGALKRYSYNDVANLHLLEYMVELAQAYHQNPSRKIWVEEFGVSDEWMPASYISPYTRALVQNAASSRNIWGFTWWCSHDIDPDIKGFLNLEYGLGLLDSKNRVKPIGRTIANLVQEMRTDPPKPQRRTVAVVIPSDTYGKPGRDEWLLLDRFIEAIKKGTHPSIVLDNRATDESYLQSRGIEDLIYVC